MRLAAALPAQDQEGASAGKAVSSIQRSKIQTVFLECSARAPDCRCRLEASGDPKPLGSGLHRDLDSSRFRLDTRSRIQDNMDCRVSRLSAWDSTPERIIGPNGLLNRQPFYSDCLGL